MKNKQNVSIGTVSRMLLSFVLVTTLSPVGAQAALADPVEPFWETPDPTPIDSTLIKTYGVRDGSAGPDFLGITNTNFDFTQGPETSPLQYTGTTAAQLDTVTGVGLAIWATTSNVSPNPYYQNLYYNIVYNPTPPYPYATTWMTNPVGLWGDSNASPSNKGNISTGAPTIAGLEYNPDIIFGANKLTAWGNADQYGTGSQTIIADYFTNNSGTLYTPNPVWTSNDATNIWGQIYTLGQLATVADSLKSGTTKVTRYNSNNATVSAIDYEKAIRGNLLYIASQIDTGAVEKKTVAYLYSIDEDDIGYFFTPTATGLLMGTDTGKAPTSLANPDANYAANNGTIVFGYRETLPFITDTYNSGNAFEDGIIMAVEDIWKYNPACTVGDEDSLAGVDVLIYNTTVLQDLAGTTGGRNSSGVGINEDYQDPAYFNQWLTDHGFTGTLIAGDDFATSVNQGYGDVDATAVGMSPLLYCQRNYTADKNAKATWAFSQVYPELYGGNSNASYGYWLEKVYHIDMADIPTVGAYMTNQIDETYFIYDASVSAALEGCFETGYNWWIETGSTDPYWSQFTYYSGSSRASYYSGLALSEEPSTTLGILAPSVLWQSSHPVASHYAYSIGCDFKGVSWWNVWVQRREDLGGDLTPSILYAADTYGAQGYQSYYSLKPTKGYLRGKNPAGKDRLGSEVVYLDGHANYASLVCGDYEYASLFGGEPTGSDYMCGVWCGYDGQSADTLYNYAGLLSRDLSGTKLISFVGCNTAGYLNGDDDGNDHFNDNLCEVALDQGAKAALGFTGSIDGLAPAGLHWKQKYNDGLAFGYTVQEAVDYANECAEAYADEHGETIPVNLVEYAIVLGDTTMTIVPA